MKKVKKVKMKVRKSISRRFRITKTGKVLRGSSFSSHLRAKKSKSRKRRLKRVKKLKGAYAIKVKKLLGEGL